MINEATREKINRSIEESGLSDEEKSKARSLNEKLDQMEREHPLPPCCGFSMSTSGSVHVIGNGSRVVTPKCNTYKDAAERAWSVYNMFTDHNEAKGLSAWADMEVYPPSAREELQRDLEAAREVISASTRPCPKCEGQPHETPCCNPACQGHWEAGCYHCHRASILPMILELLLAGQRDPLIHEITGEESVRGDLPAGCYTFSEDGGPVGLCWLDEGQKHFAWIENGEIQHKMPWPCSPSRLRLDVVRWLWSHCGVGP